MMRRSDSGRFKGAAFVTFADAAAANCHMFSSLRACPVSQTRTQTRSASALSSAGGPTTATTTNPDPSPLACTPVARWNEGPAAPTSAMPQSAPHLSRTSRAAEVAQRKRSGFDSSQRWRVHSVWRACGQERREGRHNARRPCGNEAARAPAVVSEAPQSCAAPHLPQRGAISCHNT